jgi:DNA-binding transcriptional LysR family regulator
MGAADSFALTHLSALLARLTELHPRTHIDLEIGFSTNLNRKLQAGELDIAFLTSPTASASVCVEPLLALELAWLASPKLGIHGRLLGPTELFQRPIITNPGPSHLYSTIHDWFAGAGLVPQRLNTCTSLTIVAKLTADGIGISGAATGSGAARTRPRQPRQTEYCAGPAHSLYFDRLPDMDRAGRPRAYRESRSHFGRAPTNGAQHAKRRSTRKTIKVSVPLRRGGIICHDIPH